MPGQIAHVEKMPSVPKSWQTKHNIGTILTSMKITHDHESALKPLDPASNIGETPRKKSARQKNRGKSSIESN